MKRDDINELARQLELARISRETAAQELRRIERTRIQEASLLVRIEAARAANRKIQEIRRRLE